jgi:hypothetical protein
MNVGNSVRKAIDDALAGEGESAMLHACNAVDGTAGKLYPPTTGNKARFTAFLRENYFILGPMAAPGINLSETFFPITVKNPTAGDHPDFADVVYAIHRCSHGHGDELPQGFDLLPDTEGPPGLTRLEVENGRVRLSDRTIFALLTTAVLSTVNCPQRVPDGYFLLFGDTEMLINEWWGRAPDFLDLVAQQSLPSVKLDFGDWMSPTKNAAAFGKPTWVGPPRGVK